MERSSREEREERQTDRRSAGKIARLLTSRETRVEGRAVMIWSVGGGESVCVWRGRVERCEKDASFPSFP